MIVTRMLIEVRNPQNRSFVEATKSIYYLLFHFKVLNKPPYEISETGWGEFEITVKIFFVDPNEKPVNK